MATFYARLMEALDALDLHVKIHARPNEVPEAIPFAQDEIHRSYDREYASRFWRVLVQADRVLKIFRSRFAGKCSPVHFFWGAADLAVTRFSGRPAPEHPGGIPNLPDRITREAYSHEVSSCGFWAGGGPIAYPVFYSYAYPEPAGFANGARCGPRAPSTARTFASSSCRTTRSGWRRRPTTRSWSSCRRPTRPPPTLAAWDRAALERAVEPV